MSYDFWFEEGDVRFSLAPLLLIFIEKELRILTVEVFIKTVHVAVSLEDHKIISLFGITIAI